MKLTVYITNHNYGQYIKQSIESVLNQNFTDFELLIIDDGSTDNSKEIIEEYRKQANVTIIYQNKKGLNTTNNIALRAAKGEYIMRLDADDYLDTNALNAMVNYLNKNSKAALVFPDYFMVDKDGKFLSVERRHQDFNKSVTLQDQPAHGACTMIRKKVMNEVGGYWEDFECQDGYDIWLKITKLYEVGNINLPLFYYRQHGNNLTKNELKILHTRHRMIEKSINESNNKKSSNGVAIIPMRGNIDGDCWELKQIGNTTLIDLKLNEVLKAKRISEIIISSTDKKILDYVKNNYPKIHLDERPEKYSYINTLLDETVDYIFSKYQQIFIDSDCIAILQIENPFLKSFYIDKSINMTKLFNIDSLISVSQDNGIFFNHDGHGIIPFNNTSNLKLERDQVYRYVGGLKIVTKAFFEENKQIMGKRVGHILVDELSSFTLESELQWEIAKMILESEILDKHNSF